MFYDVSDIVSQVKSTFEMNFGLLGVSTDLYELSPLLYLQT